MPKRYAPCVHCTTRSGTRPRGLCPTCYGDRTVRALYPTRSAGRPAQYEETAAELEAVIAEQRARLPAWWAAEEARALAANEAQTARTVRVYAASPKHLRENQLCVRR